MRPRASSGMANVPHGAGIPGGTNGKTSEVTTHAVLSRDRHALNTRYLGELRRRAKTPVAELPMLFTPSLTPAHVRKLGEVLLAGGAHRE